MSDDGELDKLREEYELLFNEKPHHNAKAETLRERSQISVKNWACKPRESDKGLQPFIAGVYMELVNLKTGTDSYRDESGETRTRDEYPWGLCITL